MKNHELVPVPLINQIAKLKFGGTHKSLSVLHKNKLLWHSREACMFLIHNPSFRPSYSRLTLPISLPYTDDGYRLTYAGYDYLAIRTLCARGVVSGVGTRVGVGKESGMSCLTNLLILSRSPKEVILIVVYRYLYLHQ